MFLARHTIGAKIFGAFAIMSVIIGLMKDDTELFKQFSDNPEFKRWLADAVFTATYDRPTSFAP